MYLHCLRQWLTQCYFCRARAVLLYVSLIVLGPLLQNSAAKNISCPIQVVCYLWWYIFYLRPIFDSVMAGQMLNFGDFLVNRTRQALHQILVFQNAWNTRQIDCAVHLIVLSDFIHCFICSTRLSYTSWRGSRKASVYGSYNGKQNNNK